MNELDEKLIQIDGGHVLDVAKGEQLKKRIMEQGFAPASSVFIVGNK